MENTFNDAGIPIDVMELDLDIHPHSPEVVEWKLVVGGFSDKNVIKRYLDIIVCGNNNHLY